jgi:hypothetical protein
MESIISSGNDFLLGPLSYDVMQDQASYVTSRRNSQIFANVSEVGPNAVKSVKFNLADPSGFLDLSTLCFSFTVVNTGPGVLHPLTAIPHNFWSRLIVRCSSALVEDIQHMGKTEEMFSRFMSLEKRKNAAVMGLGQTGGTQAGDDHAARTIAAGAQKRVVWRPLSSGLLNCGKWMPAMLLGAGGLTFELEVADAVAAVRNFTGESVNYVLKDMICHVDTCTLTSELTEQYSGMLLSGRSLMIPYQTIDSTIQYLAATTANHSLNISKQMTPLNTVFCSLDQEEPTITADAAGTKSRHINKFYLPGASANTIESYISVNNKRWPDHATVGAPQHWNRLIRAIGTMTSLAHSTNISDETYGCVQGTAGNSFFAAFDLERASGASASGENVNTGGLVSIHLANTGVGSSASTRAHIVANYSAVLELKDTGAFVYS